MTHTMQNEIDMLVANICNNYVGYSTARPAATEQRAAHRQTMIEEFIEGIAYTVGKKYIKITGAQGGVWGFVVNVDTDAKFPKGTILKAAGWSAPARNFARGNIITGVYNTDWTGA